MVGAGTIIGGLSLLMSMQRREEEKQQEEETKEALKTMETEDDRERLPGETQTSDARESLPPEVKAQQSTKRAVERLAEIRGVNEPGPEDTDAFASASVTLNDGETAEITVTPQDGQYLYVKKIHLDRYEDHVYSINVGGDVSSVSHRAVYSKPRVIQGGDRVIAEVTNNSGSASTLDFEVEAWGEVR